jgi:poly-gamma-glutamate synthesis protein (capsule biosynthesis protein)
MSRYKIFILCFLSLFLIAFVVIDFQLSQRPKNVLQNNSLVNEEIKVINLNTVSLILGGDVMLGRNIRETALLLKDYAYTTENIKEFTKTSDIFFVNLENPVIINCPNHNGGFKFCAPSEMLLGLNEAGVNVVSLANNHSRNYGMEGLKETEEYLKSNLISAVGLNNLIIKESNGVKLGFLGFDFTVNSPTKEDYQLVSDSDKKVDFLVVGVHWGDEYKDKANPNQRKWARSMVANGADIITGHHPHWVENFECLNPEGTENVLSVLCDGVSGKPVYYSLGNLIFDQMWSEETKKGLLIKLEINKNGVIKEERVNTYIEKLGQPEIVNNPN